MCLGRCLVRPVPGHTHACLAASGTGPGAAAEHGCGGPCLFSGSATPPQRCPRVLSAGKRACGRGRPPRSSSGSGRAVRRCSSCRPASAAAWQLPARARRRARARPARPAKGKLPSSWLPALPRTRGSSASRMLPAPRLPARSRQRRAPAAAPSAGPTTAAAAVQWWRSVPRARRCMALYPRRCAWAGKVAGRWLRMAAAPPGA